MAELSPIVALPDASKVNDRDIGRGFSWNRNLPPDPLVSVIVTVYNKEKFLRESLDSLLSQTHTNLEIVVVDDGSKDGSLDIITQFDDPRIVTVFNTKNLGPGGASNVGMVHAKGDLIARLDADDIATPKRIELQVDAFKKDPDLVLCCGHCLEIELDGTPNRVLGMIFSTKLRQQQLLCNHIAHSTVMTRRLFLNDGRQIGYPNWSSTIDYAYYSSYILCGGNMRVLPDILAQWRVTTDGISARRMAEQKRGDEKISSFLRTKFPLKEEWAMESAFELLPSLLKTEHDEGAFVLRMLEEIPPVFWRRAKIGKKDIWRIVKQSTPYRHSLLLRLAKHGSAETKINLLEYGFEFLLRRLGVKI